MKKTSFFSPDLPCLKNVCYERQAVTYQNYKTIPRQRVFKYYSIIVGWVSNVIDRFTFHMFFKRRKRMRCWMVRSPKGAFELGLSRSQYFFFFFHFNISSLSSSLLLLLPLYIFKDFEFHFLRKFLQNQR